MRRRDLPQSNSQSSAGIFFSFAWWCQDALARLFSRPGRPIRDEKDGICNSPLTDLTPIPRRPPAGSWRSPTPWRPYRMAGSQSRRLTRRSCFGSQRNAGRIQCCPEAGDRTRLAGDAREWNVCSLHPGWCRSVRLSKVQSVDQRMRLECDVGFRATLGRAGRHLVRAVRRLLLSMLCRLRCL